jgi:nondiscriminating aspartyl-tRNA synthetase
VVRDRAGATQVTLKKGTSAPELFDRLAALGRESIIAVEGTVQASPKAQRGFELLPTKIEVISASAVPLPLGVVDKVSAEIDTRLNHRVLDLRKPAVRQIFEARAALLEGFRSAFTESGFLEIETPKLLRQGAEGGSTLFRVDYFEGNAYLAQSPQLYKQMLIGAGFERVFEIAPAFRAEPSDTVRHLTEFTSLDAEIGYIDGAGDVQSALETVLKEAVGIAQRRLVSRGNPLADRLPTVTVPFPRFDFADVQKWLGHAGSEEDLGTEDEKRLGEIAATEHGEEFYFITDFPTAAKKNTFYARRKDEDPTRTGYFDLDFKGLELASGGPREHRLDRLEENLRSAGLDPANFSGYLEAFRYGMPPHGGWGFGIDRAVSHFLGLPNVREARLFPRDRYRLDP